MAFTYLGCQGFELVAREIFDISPPPDLGGFKTGVVGHSLSRYSYDKNEGGNVAFSLRETTPTSHGAGVGHWIAGNYYPSANTHRLLELGDSTGNPQLTLERNNTTGKLDLRRGGQLATVYASSDHAFTALSVHALEIWLLVADSGGRLKVLIDGIIEVDFTGDTRNVGATDLASILLPDTGVDFTAWDDFLWGTGGENDNPGFPKVAGLYPTGDGDTTQLLKSPSSVSRFYFPSDDRVTMTEPNRAAVAPAFDAAWNQTSRAIRRQLHVSRGGTDRMFGSTLDDGTSAEEDLLYEGVAADDDLLWYQYVSPPIAAQTISGTVKGQLRASEASASDNERAQIVIRVVSEDGATVRGTLLAADAGALSSEFATSAQNRKYPRGSPAALSSVICSANDRIIVEVGCRHHGSTTTSDPGVVDVGDESVTDLPEDETSTSQINPWLEFSGAITLATANGNWELAAEGPSDDGSLLTETTLDDLDLYVMENVSDFDSVLGVSLYARGRRAEGPGMVALGVKRAGTTSWGADKGLPVGFGVAVRDMALDPTDSTGWTPAKVNDSQAGWKVR